MLNKTETETANLIDGPPFSYVVATTKNITQKPTFCSVRLQIYQSK